MRTLLLTVLLTILTLTTSAEEITTGNLLPNAGDGVDWNSSSTDQINPGSSGYVSNNATMNGFTVTCPTSQSNCGYKWSVGGDFEVTGTATGGVCTPSGPVSGAIVKGAGTGAPNVGIS